MKLNEINEKINYLHDRYNNILDNLNTKCWEDKRDHEKKEQVIDEISSSMNFIKIIPDEKEIPIEIKQNYQEWYSSCCALIEKNYNKERVNEFKDEYEKIIKNILSTNYIAEEKEYKLIDSMKHQFLILKALPKYLEFGLFDLELTIASILMDDELHEAEYLLKKGFIRASGAIAGVILERYLKMMCDKQQPKLKYTKNVTIGKLNDILKNNGVIELIKWRNIQYLGDVRNTCDHDKENEPKKDEVLKLIVEVKKIIHDIEE